MEIVSIVLSGRLRHEDNLGNVAETAFGGIQRMSAGTGAIHTEHNPSDTEPVRLLQLWFMPHSRGTAPSYTTGRFDLANLDGRLLPVVAAERGPEVVDIAQDMTIYLGRAAGGEKLDFRQEPGRRVFLYVIEGQLRLPDQQVLRPGDSARIVGLSELPLAADEELFVMAIDLP
ncbi:Quercetin 2,3-dioxygenase [compost metagenome]